MCATCGCGGATLATDHSQEGHAHGAQAAYRHHDHPHDHDHVHDHDHAHGEADRDAHLAHVHAPHLNQERILRIERDILSKNDAYARANRARLAQKGVFALNFVSSPGSGKTSLLARAIADLKDRHAIAVIEGDQQTSLDAERIRAAGARALQINTGKGCHLDAHMVGHAIDELALEENSLLFIENVGNLVCPAAFDLGEAHKVVVLSVTEGDDKPMKYPDMFAAADLMLINKVDLLPHVDFRVEACTAAAFSANPHLQALSLSALTGEGMFAFYAWIEARAALAAAESRR